MSRFFLRNNFKKYLYQFNKLSSSYRHSYTLNKKPQILAQKLKPVNSEILRYITSKTLAIKEYKSSRIYTSIWIYERLMGWLLAFMIPTAFVVNSKELEMAIALVALSHTYWGCMSMCSDYLRSAIVGKYLPVLVRVMVIILCTGSLVGFYQLIYEDVGIIAMVKMFWSIRGKD